MKEVTIRGREMTMSMAMCRCGSLVAYGVRCCSGMLQDQDRMDAEDSRIPDRRRPPHQLSKNPDDSILRAGSASRGEQFCSALHVSLALH